MKSSNIFIIILFFSIFSISADALNAFSHSIFFDENKSTLNNHDRLSFRIYLDSIFTTNDVVGIEVNGYCDDGEYANFFLDLSQKRLKFIANELKSVFTSQELKTIHWCIKNNQSLDDNSFKKLLEKSRRIDIVFQLNSASNTKLKKGDKFILNGILFQAGMDLLDEESMPTLKTLYQELIKHPLLVIQIQGHIYDADFFANGDQQESLSARRAKRIYDYLIFKGIDPKRLSYIGLEGQFPLHKGAKYDRRVEVEIVNI